MMLKGAKMARLGSARLGSARLGSARLGSSIAPFFQCVKFYYIKLSCKIRKQGELCPDFGFFLLWGRGLAIEALRLTVRYFADASIYFIGTFTAATILNY